MATQRTQAGLRLPNKTISKLKKRAEKKNMPFNEYCTLVLEAHLGVNNLTWIKKKQS